jgi:predicted dehydrogenase
MAKLKNILTLNFKKQDNHKIPIALIGNGYWGSKILKYAKDQFNVKYVITSKDSLKNPLEDKEVKAAIIATPIETHYHISKKFLKENKHVLIEKPITLYRSEAVALQKLAEEKNLKIGVNYVLCFSEAVRFMISNLAVIGSIEHIHMSTKHLGRYMAYDVFWLLASHHLSILANIIDLSKTKFRFKKYIYKDNLCTTGAIEFFLGRIDVSTDFPGKELFIHIYGKDGIMKYEPLSDNPLKIILHNKEYKKLPEELITYTSGTFYSDESNNLRNSMKFFQNLI